MKKHLIFPILFLLICLTGCSGKPAATEHRFEELRLSLPAAYVNLTGEKAFTEYDFLFSDGTVTLAGIREEKALLPGFHLQSYGQLVIRAHRLDCQLLQSDGITYFNYEAGVPAFTYVVGLWETEDAFWSVQAYCKSEDYAASREAMWQLLQSVTF